MNHYAYRTTSLAIQTLSNFLRARINIHGKENIPKGSLIFVINHFTRVETLLLPYHIFKLTGVPVWSLAHSGLFKGPLATFLERVGAVSTEHPDRDRLIVKSLLKGEASWIIFPEGCMVKDKKIIEKGRYMITCAGGQFPPHTGAAQLALRTEFYRQRLFRMSKEDPREARRLMELFQIDSIEPLFDKETYIVPVNITYYPIRVRENIISNLAVSLVEKIPEHFLEEIMTEGTMLLTGVDVDIRFGVPIEIKRFLKTYKLHRDISARRRINFDDYISSERKVRKAALQIMQCYMSSIYSMATVNHDHFFASMLRLMPSKTVEEQDLRRRVFLATTKFDKTGIHLHRSLDVNQVHLLTDDRFNKFRDFLSVALEKGIIREEGRAFTKDHSALFSAFDFHSARIDNPLAVIANEVEPLRSLQSRLRRLAWMPGFWLRRQIVNHLLTSVATGFEEDYGAFYDGKESKHREIGMPLLIKGRSRKIGVVLVHGYMAAPFEVKELAEYLGRMGISVFVPRLKGHGTSPNDLATRTYMDWVESVDEGYAIMSNRCKRVIAGGFSAGAGLALDLAARVRDVMGVFAVCPPFRLQDFSSKFVPAVDVWNRLMKTVHRSGAKMEFVENHSENPHINYLRNPISGVRELVRFMELLGPKLSSIKVPALVVQANRDPLVDPRGSRRIFEMLGSEEKEYLVFNFNRHGILLGEGSARVHRAIGNFVRRLQEMV